MAAAADGVDWVAFQNLVVRHRVAGLVNHALQKEPLPLPTITAQWLSSAAHAIALTGLKQLGETVRLQTMFAASGIHSLAVKGITLGQKVYGSVGIKYNHDIDLLLQPAKLRQTLALMEEDGYRITQPGPDLTSGQIAAFIRYSKNFGFTKSQGSLVEIHWQLTDNLALLDHAAIDWTGQDVSIGQRMVSRTLTDEDHFAYLCVHGANHNWGRLKWICDVNALIATASSETQIMQWWDHAQSLGAGLCTAQALRLCQRLFDIPLPEPLKAPTATPRAQRLAQYACGELALSQSELSYSVEREVMDFFVKAQLGGGWRFWLGILHFNLVKVSVILELRLPERLVFFYPIIRPFFWLWFRWISPRGRYRWNRKSVDTTT